MTDIRNNVYAGRVVTAHEHNINFNGWSGSGYIIVDPNTGTGAYLIDGGANGGFAFALGLAFSALLTCFLIAFMNPGLLLVSASLTAPFLLGIAGPLIAFFLILTSVMLYANKDDDFIIGCFLGGVSINAGLLAGRVGGGDIGSLIVGFIFGVQYVNSWGQCYGI